MSKSQPKKSAVVQPKKSAAAKLVAAKRTRDEKGKFQSGPILPPSANVVESSMFAGIPNPVNKVYYNPDEAFRADQENSSRMLFDPAIFSSLQERQLAGALLPWSIVPPDERNKRHRYAAEKVRDIIYETPNLTEYFRGLLDAIWFGRAANFNEFAWRFNYGRRRMVVQNWTPVHPDSLLFDDTGLCGYRVGVGNDPEKEFIGVEGRGERILEKEKVCWVPHAYQRVPGEWRQFTQAAARFGYGLRSRLYPCYLIKGELWASLANWNEKFKSGWVVAYFERGNTASYDAIKEAMEDQSGSATYLFPRASGGEGAPEGMDVIDPPDGSIAVLQQIEKLDKYIRLTMCGQELTAGSDNGGTLGGNLGEIHANTFGHYVQYDALSLQETLTKHLVAPLQEWNGFGDIPPLRFQFSFDLSSGEDKINKAKLLKETWGIDVDKNELIQAAGFKIPVQEEIDEQQEDIDDTTENDD